MSKLARAAYPIRHRHPEDQLREKFKFNKRMEPYVRRIRLTVAHFDLTGPNKLRLEEPRREMTKILVKKKIRPEEAQRAIAQTLDIAADHQLEVLRRDQNLRDFRRSQSDLKRLIKQLDRVGLDMSKLPPLVKGKLNKIIVNQDWQNFDTEMFGGLIRAMIGELSRSSPVVTAKRVITAMNEKIRSNTPPAVARIVRTSPPAILELWEIIPAETRNPVEAELRNWVPPRRPAIAFLNHVVVLLQKFQPQRKWKRRRPAIERHFGDRVAQIWQSLGLRVGRAFSGGSGYRGLFQRFADLALYAVGDDSRLSNRQTIEIKSRIRKNAIVLISN